MPLSGQREDLPVSLHPCVSDLHGIFPKDGLYRLSRLLSKVALQLAHSQRLRQQSPECDATWYLASHHAQFAVCVTSLCTASALSQTSLSGAIGQPTFP